MVEDLTGSDDVCESLLIKCRVSGVGDIIVSGVFCLRNKAINQFFDHLNSIFLDVLDRDNTDVKNYMDLFNQQSTWFHKLY